MFKYLGQCQCREVKVTLQSALKPEEFQPRSDAKFCHFCAKHGGVWISDPKGFLHVDVNNKTKIERFASEQVQFHFCMNCQDLTYAIFVNPDDSQRVAVVRVALFNEIAPVAKPVIGTNFDGETKEAGKKRRLTNWTPID
ncbi:MAG TPA: hypothetical protein VF412_05725 [Bdellovibrio sp.]|uniref:hypothetical protein n=1 Tax=Bdellovibrio sp. TaxID=28201 RepID=UPI002EE8052E